MDNHEKRTADLFDAGYKKAGVRAQRLYPNEQLVWFIAANYFSIPHAERHRVRILEVGCGNGRNLWMLAKEGFTVYGVDASATAIEVARTHLQDKWGVQVHLYVGSFDSLPFDNDYFDAVCDVVSLQHTSLNGSRRALAEIRRCLKPRGLFFSYRLSDASIMYQCSGGQYVDAATVDNISDPSMPLANNGQTSFWSPVIAREILQEQGFSLINVERYGRTYGGGTQYVEYLAIVGVKDMTRDAE